MSAAIPTSRRTDPRARPAGRPSEAGRGSEAARAQWTAWTNASAPWGSPTPTGDIPVYDEPGRLAIAELEDRAAERLSALLPEPEASSYLALWHEFESAETDDARFARALDRLQPILVHWAGGGVVWRERGTTIGDERRLLAMIEQYWPPLMPLATAIVEDALARGMLVRSH